MSYVVRWTETSQKQLKKLDPSVANRIVDKVEDVSKNPFLYVEKLRGFDLYKLRVGDYRVIMSIENNKMVIFVLQVGHRSTIYRRY